MQNVTPATVQAAMIAMYSTAAARVRGDHDDAAVLLAAAVDENDPALVIATALTSTAEMVATIAHSRGIDAPVFAGIIAGSLPELAPGMRTVAMGAVTAMLSGDRAVVAVAATEMLHLAGGDAHEAVRFAVSVLSASVLWRCQDMGVDPVAYTRDMCLSAAASAPNP
jgi:hypothetical protein